MGFRENVRREIELRYSGNFSRFAKEHGLSNSYLNEILSGKRRLNEDMLKKLSRALGKPLYLLFADEPVVPYKECEPRISAEVKEAVTRYGASPDIFEAVKLFGDPVSLGPGFELSEMVPEDYAPILKNLLPRGYKSDRDRIVAFPTKGFSMKPTINDGSIVWIDRKDVTAKEGEIYAFLLLEATNAAVSIKRLLKVDRHFLIIDADNKDPEDRKTDELKDFPMVLDLRQYGEDLNPIRGRVIWVLNRLIEKPKK